MPSLCLKEFFISGGRIFDQFQQTQQLPTYQDNCGLAFNDLIRFFLRCLHNKPVNRCTAALHRHLQFILHMKCDKCGETFSGMS
jgi:hypothetical protein